MMINPLCRRLPLCLCLSVTDRSISMYWCYEHHICGICVLYHCHPKMTEEESLYPIVFCIKGSYLKKSIWTIWNFVIFKSSINKYNVPKIILLLIIIILPKKKKNLNFHVFIEHNHKNVVELVEQVCYNDFEKANLNQVLPGRNLFWGCVELL